MKKNNFITTYALFLISLLCNNIIASQENQKLVAWGSTNKIAQLPKNFIHPKEKERLARKAWAELTAIMAEDAQYRLSFVKPLSAAQSITQSTTRKEKNSCFYQEEKRENTLLHTAVKDNDIETVRTLLSFSSVSNQINREYNQFGFTSLSVACIYNSYESAKLLLELDNINPNCLAFDISTPLHHAIEFGNIGIVRLLLAHKNIDPTRQDYNAGNEPHNTPLHVACFKKNTTAAKLLLEHKSHYGNWYTVNPNRKNTHSLTPLHVAVMQGDVATTTLLLNHKDIDPNCRTQDTTTPLHIAVAHKNIEIVCLLIEHPKTIVNMGCLDFNGENNLPLDLAYKTGNRAIIAFLLLHGAKTSAELN